MKIGIVGIGVVGNATMTSFIQKGIDVTAYDKFKNIGDIGEVLKADMIFLCLPTLYDMSIKSYNKEALHEVCNFLSDKEYNGPVIVKSTVEPGTTNTLAKKYKLQMIHNPEFLTARTAFEDFHNQTHIIIGSSDEVNVNNLNLVVEFFKSNYSSAMITNCSSTESEIIKISCNCFYAVKIQFCNELYLMCQKLNIDYSFVMKTMIKNGWINPMHTQVPGTDGKLSFGGMCFPKDVNALLSFMKEINTPHSVLESVIQERDIIRGED